MLSGENLAKEKKLLVQSDAPSMYAAFSDQPDMTAWFTKLSFPLANPFGAPNSVGNDTFQSPNLYGFDEDQNILLAADLIVDVGSSPIPAGTVVASHYIFFDPGPSQTIIGTVDFDADVLAIMTGILFATTASTPGDYVRVLTEFSPNAAAVPEPGSLSLFGTGMVGLGALIGYRTRSSTS